MKNIRISSLIAMTCVAPDASASFQMFCELEGEVISSPRHTEVIEFQFKVEAAREIEVEILGPGNPGCHFFQGKTLDVVLDISDAAEIASISKGSRITLERYHINVILNETDSVVRSVKYVRTDN